MIEEHPLCLDNRNHEIAEGEENPAKVQVLMTSWENSSVNMRAWVWTSNYADSFRLECEVLEEVKKRFQVSGITIPFPQLRIHQ